MKIYNRKIIAVLRYITTEEIEGVCDALVEGGISQIEVTTNSPDFKNSLEKIVKRYPSSIRIGAGTVTSLKELHEAYKIGATFIVSPHTDTAIIAQTNKVGLRAVPGIFTPTDAIIATQSGAMELKFFPASWAPITAAKDLKAVLPEEVKVYAVGGVEASSFSKYIEAGFDGFGIGNSLYRKGMSIEEVKKNCSEIITAYDKAVSNN